MCKAFSCIVSKQFQVFWKAGVDSHDDLIEQFKIKDLTADKQKILFARVEILPPNRYKYPYLHPEGKWELQIDERVKPEWWTPAYKKVALDALEEWKAIVYQFNLKEVLHPIHPFKLPKAEVTEQDIENLKKWASVGASVWASVRASVGASVRDSVGASVWDSVGGYVGSFLRLPKKEWKYTENIKGKGYPLQPVVDLWNMGLVPSVDGKKWRLHGGKDAKILWEGEIK